MPDNVPKENVPEEVISPVNLDNIEKGISSIKEDSSLINDNIKYFIDEYKVYKESIEKEKEEGLESSKEVGFEEIISSIGEVDKSINELNEYMVQLNSSICLFLGFIVAYAVADFVMRGLFKNV